MAVRIIPSAAVWPLYPLFGVALYYISKFGYSLFDSTCCDPPDNEGAEKLFCCLSLGSSEQKAGGVFLLLTHVKSQQEFFAFLGFKQRSAQLLRDGKPV